MKNGKDKAIHLRLDDVDLHAFQALSARQAFDVDKKVPCRHLLTELLLQEVDKEHEHHRKDEKTRKNATQLWQQ